MIRWKFTDAGLLLLSLLLAAGLVWIKGQERIDRRTLNGIPISLENLPPNLVLPDNWVTPNTVVIVQGPRNTIDLIRQSQSGFYVDMSKVPLAEGETPASVILTSEMFLTNLVDETDRNRIAVVEESIVPRQLSFYILPWDITQPQPSYENLEAGANQLAVPLLRVQKNVPVTVPLRGDPPGPLHLDRVRIDPPEVTVTGPRQAVDKIKSVSTPLLDLEYISLENPLYLMPLPDLEQDFGVRPVEKSIRSVTVTLILTKKGT
ncbi:MAG TPA: YbbR-like domain-containing protein [bacterium]|nr:YbbR-like domain-containing protein [Candidatus Omnitrophota bacterium]HOJ59275.1 YbbR-like domain-containing protein [bacterium]HOL94660.1 YbbR-like domain-containing protein [bacterium]HPP03135.1 YbbR-like domain-containing protein [bacterium]